jgi:hypothetical protein
MKPFTPGLCVNCDSHGVTVRSPLYCSPFCRQAAEVVRYVRACRGDGRWLLPDVKEAIQMRLAMVLGGGYTERERVLPQATRQLVFDRAGGRCESCGRLLDFDRSTGDDDAIPTIQPFGQSLERPEQPSSLVPALQYDRRTEPFPASGAGESSRCAG